MSTRWRKRNGPAVKSKQAWKRSRLMVSSAGGTSEAEPIDLEENAVEEIIDFTGEYSGLEVTNPTGDDSVMQWEHKEKHQLVSEAADENSPMLPARDNEQVPVNGYEQQRRNLAQSESSVLSSDDEDETRASDVYVPTTASQQQGSLDEETSSSK